MKIVIITLLVAFCSSYVAATFTASSETVLDYNLTFSVTLSGTDSALYTAGYSLVSSLETNLNASLSTLNGYLQNLISNGVGDVDVILAYFQSNVSPYFEATISSLSGIVATAKLFARSALPYLLALLQNVVNQKVRLILSVVSAFQQALAAAIAVASSAVSTIQAVLTQAIQLLEAALQQAISFGLTLVANVLILGQIAIDGAVSTVVSLTSVLKDELVSRIVDLVNALENGANLTVAQIQDYVNQIVGAIGALLNSVGQDLTAIGNASQLIAAGVLARLTSLLNAVILNIESVIAYLQSNASGSAAAAYNALISLLQSLLVNINGSLTIVVNYQISG